jgi:hypothetical protein
MSKLSKILLTLIINSFGMLALAQTLNPTPPVPELNLPFAPSFYFITSITGSSQVIETEPELGFPTAKLYTFKLCVAHPLNKSPLKGTNISLEGSTIPLIPQALDDSCLSWTENINYHYTAPARYITLQRSLILQTSPNSVTIPIQFAINPWLHGESTGALEITDFIKIKPRSPVSADKAVMALAGKDLKSLGVPIIANDARVNFQELGLDSRVGGRFLFDFRTNPQIELTNAAGQPVYLKLSTGEFQFEAYLLSTLFEGDTQVRRIVNPVPLKGTAYLRDGAVAFLQEITLPAIPSRGRLELAVILTPKQNHPYLRTFKSIYILGEHNEIKSNLYARLKTGFSNASPSFNFEEYVGLNKPKESTFNSQNAEPNDGLRRLKYEFEPLTFRLTRIGEESATEREVYYQVRACVRNGTDNTPLRGYHFNISKGDTQQDQNNDLSPSTRVSEYDSCIYWDDKITHKFYASQQYIRTEYRIQNKDLNFDETLTGYINPWDMALSRDGRTIEADKITQPTTERSTSAFIYLPSYKLRMRTINYGLDANMHLSVKKEMHLLLEPQILNYSNISRGIDSKEPIRDGVWKVRWALLRNRYESKQSAYHLLSRGESLTLATNGRIVLPITLSYSDFRFIDSRNYLMLEIAPVNPQTIIGDNTQGIIPKDPAGDYQTTVDHAAGLSPQTFLGPMISSNEDEVVGYTLPHPMNPALQAFISKTTTMNIGAPADLTYDSQAPLWGDLPAINVEPPVLSPEQKTHLQNKFYVNSNAIRSWNLNEPTDRIALRRHMGPSPLTLKNFSLNYQRDLFMTEMVVRALQRHELTAELQDRLCFYFFDQNPVQPIAFNQRLMPWKRSDQWLKRCLNSVNKKVIPFFKAQLETIVSSINSVEPSGSTSSSVGVGASFSVSSSESTSISTSASVSTQVGVSLKLNEMVSVGAGGSYSLSRSESSSTSAGNGLSISTGVSLNVRRLLLNIAGTFQQQCLTAELNPALFLSEKSDLRIDVVRALTSQAASNRYLTQKVRFCLSKDELTSFRTTETFYFVTQDGSTPGFLDSPDLRNRQLLLQLRGDNAYENFLKFIGARMVNPSASSSFDPSMMVLDEKAARSLRLMMPTIPGVVIETL